MIIKDIDLPQLYANSDKILWESQQTLEHITKESFNARQLYTDARFNYDMAYADEIGKLKQSKEPVTLIKEMAKFNCKELYKIMIDCENIKKKMRYSYNVLLERIQTIKKLITDTKPIR